MNTKNILAAFLITGGIVTAVHPAFAKDGDIERRGSIGALSASSVTVNDLTCPITSNTEFEGLQGQRISVSQFAVGDIVKLVCRNGTAHSLELENDNGNSNSDDDGSDDRGRNSGSGNSREVRVRARFVSPGAPASTARAKLDFRQKSNGSKRDDRFKLTVKIPVPSSLPPINSLDEAEALLLTAVLTRDGVPYAECDLSYDRVAIAGAIMRAEFKLDVRARGRKARVALKNSKGSCDVDPASDGLQSGFPQLKRGDILQIIEAHYGEIALANIR